MRNVVAVMLIAGSAIAALISTGGSSVGTEAAVAQAAARNEQPAATPRWEYRVLSARVNAVGREANGDGGTRFVGLQTSTSTSAAVSADPLAKLERELNRLGGEGWEMCSAAADGTMVFRRAMTRVAAGERTSD